MTTIKLIPVAMITPSKECIYAPSKLRHSIQIDKSHFEANFKATVVNVSLHTDGISDSQNMNGYTETRKPLAGRFIIE